MNTDDDVAALIAALRASEWEHFAQLAAAFGKAGRDGTLWPALARAHGNEVDIFERLLAWPPQDLLLALRRLLPAVEHLDGVASGDAARLLEFANRVEPSFRHVVAQQLRPHVAASSNLGTELGGALRRGDVTGEMAARVWAEAFWLAAPSHAADFALSLLGGKLHDTALLAALLQFLPRNEASIGSLLGAREAELASALHAAAPALGRNAWDALTSIAHFSALAMDALHTALKASEADAVMAISSWLYQVSSPTVGATAVPLDHLVDDLLRAAVSDNGVRRWVDSGLAALLQRAGLRAVVVPSIQRLGPVDADVAEWFPATFAAVSARPSEFTELLTRWLVGDGVAFAAIRSLLSLCSARSAPVGIDADVLTSAAPPRRVVAARRLLAMTHDGPVLCQFIACLAETPALQPEGLQLAAQMLNEAFVEYPGATREFLKTRIATTRRTDPFAHVYRGVCANVLKWERVLKRLPVRKELRPTEGQLQALRAMRQRMNRDIMREAHKRSILASFATQIHVAQGRRFTSHSDRSDPEVVDMQSTSHVMELPSSELADPVGGMLMRARQLAASR